MFSSLIESPIGLLIIKANEHEVFSINFPDQLTDQNPNKITERAKVQFIEYFEGKRNNFDFPMLQIGTEFQKKVWNELRRIDAGKPITYATLAKRMKNPLAIRAIASANGKNNLLVAIPCHRVIGSNGELIGFSAGLWRKKWLLEHEAKITRSGQSTLNYEF
ncbi:MAG: methylated-DNA--[protein]-cysteine S-methyltransferase [Bacteroidetes bacterium]|jgi:methylated-DNA-[protein]-cysteine S-methyltransferase|uniref:methylated-DNA--[protein]-cysteine S-methyltransferase n=1 Tax=Daejeonella sp. TaxID=2805397 RepID=UPI00404AB0FA|nr:methylated-DNA--[protein]-cysteine S-methyltransferase [Bacteroidota bacterium]